MGSPPDLHIWEPWRTMLLVSGFSRGSLVSPAHASRRCPIPRFTLIGSQDLDETWLTLPLDSGFYHRTPFPPGPRWVSVRIVPDNSAVHWVFSGIFLLLRPSIPALLHSHAISQISHSLSFRRRLASSAAQIRRAPEMYATVTDRVYSHMRVAVSSRERNGAELECKGVGAEIPEKTPPTSGIVRHGSQLRKSGVTRPGIEPRFALVGGEQSNRSATAAPIWWRMLDTPGSELRDRPRVIRGCFVAELGAGQ
ncbi:hypothetical protein PR048_025756 [Dryococelus australis]|uniref:Uncharacterized protein n=1 Tax=Dryococelus australis TaxID=614101 RepID=A0ABQ9GJH3_9NEOP|nr:hypothetical protein PR048_025756 [Dryococelus australis]